MEKGAASLPMCAVCRAAAAWESNQRFRGCR
nr:MAG TPA: hypothetical protein [Caudoviricetes sp.]DAY00611.1 MAG TPA: hypothetical protein [Caudoviricetes sp.]